MTTVGTTAGPTWVLNNDLVAISRGRAVIGYDPVTIPQPTVGWVPADLALDAFGGLVDNPWGPIGDLRLRPDPSTLVEIDVAPVRLPPFRFVLADCIEVDGRPWPSCPRTILAEAAERLEARFGLRLLAAFEHEFALLRPDVPVPFSIDAARRAEPLLSTLVGAMTAAGIEPENVLPEFGNNQIELTAAPAIGVAGADRAVTIREIVYETARACGEPITFAPMIGVGAGTNGAHIHFSLLDTDDRPIDGDPRHPTGLSPKARRFAAGVMAHLPALTAITAPSAASYLRLQPHSWSAAYRVLGLANREAALRVPLRPRPTYTNGNLILELRSVDATANPYLALAALISAGMDGLDRRLDLPVSIDTDPHGLSECQRHKLGIERLPTSLDAALDALAADDVVGATLATDELSACWFNLKRAEADRFRSSAPRDIVEAYVRAY